MKYVDKNRIVYTPDKKVIVGLDMPEYELEGNLVIKDGVEKIEEAIFEAAGITDVEFPESLRIINESAFEDCTKLEKVNIPNPDVIIYMNAFSGCCNLKEITTACKHIPIAGFARGGIISGGMDVLLKDTIDINEYAFCGSRINNITFPDTLESIEEAAFNETYFANPIIKLPKNLKFLGYNAFWNSNVTDVYVPDGIKEIKNINHDIKWHMSHDIAVRFGLIHRTNVVIEENTLEAMIDKMSFREANKKMLKKSQLEESEIKDTKD